MPCDTIQRSSITLTLRADNKEHLINALKSLGYQVEYQGSRFYTPDGLTGTFRDGQLTITGRSGQPELFNPNPIRRAYAREVVKSQAKKHGWKLKQTQDEFTFEVEKDSFEKAF